jgi:hypothetical protein
VAWNGASLRRRREWPAASHCDLLVGSVCSQENCATTCLEFVVVLASLFNRSIQEF